MEQSSENFIFRIINDWTKVNIHNEFKIVKFYWFDKIETHKLTFIGKSQNNLFVYKDLIIFRLSSIHIHTDMKFLESKTYSWLFKTASIYNYINNNLFFFIISLDDVVVMLTVSGEYLRRCEGDGHVGVRCGWYARTIRDDLTPATRLSYLTYWDNL